MKHKKYIGLKITEKPEVLIDGEPYRVQMRLPEGCIGIAFVFSTKTAGRKCLGKNAEFVAVEER